MELGDTLELNGNIVKIEKKYCYTLIDLYELGSFINCTVEMFEDGIVVIQDKSKNGGSCGLFILDTKRNKIYGAVLYTPEIKHYRKLPY